MNEVGVPLFIPPEGRAALSRVEICAARALVAQLEHLSALGSNWAAAALATILVYPDANGRRSLDRARELVSRPASAGDAYATYVLAWVELYRGEKAACLRLLKQSAKSGFSPAVLDLAAAFQPKDPSRGVGTTVRLLERAEAMGHLAARSRIFKLWIQGRLGWARRIPGLLGFAFTSTRLFVKLHQEPVSVRVYCIHDFRNPPVRR
ncbi:MAG TPA: hypothetical protein VMH26_04145, partial [Burkholderiales bacterium]|nr:hypothetical protein [Burkholderiales bacterium]